MPEINILYLISYISYILYLIVEGITGLNTTLKIKDKDKDSLFQANITHS